MVTRNEVIAGIIITLVYISITVWISDFYTTLTTIPYYLSSINWLELGTSILFTISIGVLIAANAVLSYSKYTAHKKIKTQSTATCIAAIGGISTGVCPACLGGLVPVIASSFGITLSWTALPFRGLEVQAGIIALLGGTLIWQHKKQN